MMRQLMLTACILIAITGHAAEHSESDLSALHVTFDIEPSEILAGEPAALRIHVENQSDTVLQLPQSFVVQVQSKDSTFLTLGQDGSVVYDLIPGQYADDELAITPHSRSEFYVYVSESVASVLMDRGLNSPGRYTIRLAFSPKFVYRLPPTIKRLVDLPASFEPLLQTNEAALRVTAPEGEDAAIWKQILDLSHGEGWLGLSVADSYAIAAQIRTAHPNSRYALTFGTLINGRAPQSEKDAILARLEARAPKGPLVDWFRLHDAGVHAAREGHALMAKPIDVTTAIAEADRARLAYEKLSSDARNDIVRRVAKDAAADTMHADDILDFVSRLEAARNPGHASQVSPIALCIAGSGDEPKVFFGYFNPNVYALSFPVGSQNQVSPPPAGRGQPTTFAPGRHDDVMIIKFRKGSPPPAWTLDGNTATASASLLPCQDDKHDADK